MEECLTAPQRGTGAQARGTSTSRRQRAAAERLRALLDSGTANVEILERALTAAAEAGGDSELVREDLRRGWQLASIFRELRAAVVEEDVERLRCALGAAEDLRPAIGNASLPLFAAARTSLAKAEERATALRRLTDAMEKAEVVYDSPAKDMDTLELAKVELTEGLDALRRLMQPGLVEMPELRTGERVRRRLHNTIMDLKGATRIFCRLRPMSIEEQTVFPGGLAMPVVYPKDGLTVFCEEMEDPGGKARGWEQSGDKRVAPRPTSYEFDSVFGDHASQAEVFETCEDLVESVIDGYNVTIFAYGQTGSGKTYTMMGDERNPGICPRFVRKLFKMMATSSDRFDFRVKASLTELYMDSFQDLGRWHPRGVVVGSERPGRTSDKRTSAVRALSDDPEMSMTRSSLQAELRRGAQQQQQHGSGQAAPRVTIREDTFAGQVSLEGVTEVEFKNPDDLLKFLERGNQRRQVASTKMNERSSRSHTVLEITLRIAERKPDPSGGGITIGPPKTAKALLVDLAGSERLKRTSSERELKKEAIEINRSLTALGDVIFAVSQKAAYIPYKNHKLTQLMQDSLGGTAKALTR